MPNSTEKQKTYVVIGHVKVNKKWYRHGQELQYTADEFEKLPQVLKNSLKEGGK